MTVRMAGKSIAERVREARALLDRNPEVLSQLDEEARAEREAAQRDAKRLSDARAKVERDLDERVRQLIADFGQLEQEAIAAAAREIAAAQLDFEHGVVPRTTYAMTPLPMRLSPDRVERQRRKLSLSMGLPWHEGRPAAAVASAVAREASEALGQVDVVAQRIEERKAQLAEQQRQQEQARQERIAQRKSAAGLGKPKAA